MRIGHGYDIHRLAAAGTLMVGGVAASHELHAIAHSDGDVVLHALVDALLGALGQGDIGQHFPNTDPRWKGADSAVFVQHALGLARAQGYALGNVDVTVLAEKPRLSPIREAMRRRIAGLLGVDPSAVNVKFGTNEQCDAIGQGQAIAAHVVLLLRRLDLPPAAPSLA